MPTMVRHIYLSYILHAIDCVIVISVSYVFSTKKQSERKQPTTTTTTPFMVFNDMYNICKGPKLDA
jgi:hypothetical protein